MAKAAIEVTAGLIPGQAMSEYTRRWAITSDEWQFATQKDREFVNSERDMPMATTVQGELLTQAQGKAMAYAQMLMLQPNMLNWVSVNWVWF
jgi:hypothetical protein